MVVNDGVCNLLLTPMARFAFLDFDENSQQPPRKQHEAHLVVVVTSPMAPCNRHRHVAPISTTPRDPCGILYGRRGPCYWSNH